MCLVISRSSTSRLICRAMLRHWRSTKRSIKPIDFMILLSERCYGILKEWSIAKDCEISRDSFSCRVYVQTRYAWFKSNQTTCLIEEDEKSIRTESHARSARQAREILRSYGDLLDNEKYYGRSSRCPIPFTARIFRFGPKMLTRFLGIRIDYRKEKVGVNFSLDLLKSAPILVFFIQRSTRTNAIMSKPFTIRRNMLLIAKYCETARLIVRNQGRYGWDF